MMIYQSEAAECGLACVAMVSNHYGHKVDLSTLRNRYNVSFKGANLQQLMQLAEQLLMVGRALKLELDELRNLKTPCILHWDMNHFVVLKKVHSNYIVILDPAVGERKLTLKEVDKSFTGVALELTPTNEFKQIDEWQKLSITSFWSKIEGLWPNLTKLLVLSLLLQLLLLAAPYYTQIVVDEVLVTFDRNLLIVLAIGFGLVMLFRVVIETFRSWLVLFLGSTLSVQMATNLMRHLIHLPMNYFDKRHMGDIVSRFGSLNDVRDLFTNKIVEGVIDGTMSIVVLVMMFLYDTTLAFVVLGVVILYAAIRFALYRPLHQLTESSIVASAAEQSNFMESVRGMQSIKLFGQQAQRLNLWQNKYTESINQAYKLGKWHISYQTINSLLFGIENILIVYLAAFAVIEGSITVGMLFAFMAYKNQFTNRMAGLIGNLINIKMIRLHLDRLADIALTDQEDEGLTHQFQTITGELNLESLKFRYADNEPLLFNDLSLKIKTGQNVAIIGPSGTGKTTLMKIMLGLLSPESGKVLSGDIDIYHLGLRHYRQQIASVMQEDELMSGTLAENISFFDPELDMDQVVNAAALAGIHQDISAMNMGYNSLVGDMGNSLSGGQKQRILLARALYRKPKILFLDEATSHLDIQLEHQIVEAIKALPMTRVVIAHRPESVLSADVIYQLVEGKLVDFTEQYHSQFNLR